MSDELSPFLALQHRNFRLLWAGQGISIAGTMMQSAAVLWHVSLLVPSDQRGLALGLVGLARVVPILLFSLVSGVVADALDRRKVLLLTQSTLALTAFVLALITFGGLDVVWPIYVLSALTAAVASFDGPARQSFFPSLVPRQHLPNAISLNTIIFQFGSVLGPTLAGLLIAGAGVGWVYLVNAISFLAVIVALLLMRGVPRHHGAEKREVSLRAAAEGLRYVFSEPLIRSSMLLDFFATFFSSATALLPIFVQDILQVGPEAYGLLAAAPSIGALATSAAMVRLVDRIVHRGRVLLWAVAGYGMATVVFGLSQSFWLTFTCLALTGAADTVSVVLRNLTRQLVTPDHLRGRMTGVNMIFFLGGPQLGELEAGLLAQAFGAPVSVVTGGIGCLIATGWIAAKTPQLRHYRREEPALVAAVPQPADVSL
ncbi:MAG TPA: MFS transporter [Anaerolineae bacterium]|nr:MFS transporter [Anaerolineae bacterium]